MSETAKVGKKQSSPFLGFGTYLGGQGWSQYRSVKYKSNNFQTGTGSWLSLETAVFFSSALRTPIACSGVLALFWGKDCLLWLCILLFYTLKQTGIPVPGVLWRTASVDFSQDDNLIHINYRLYQNKFLLVTYQGFKEWRGTSFCCTVLEPSSISCSIHFQR